MERLADCFPYGSSFCATHAHTVHAGPAKAMPNISACLLSLRQRPCVWEPGEELRGLLARREIASGYQTLLSPDTVKGFLPFASLSSLGLKDEKKNAECVRACERVCVCARAVSA